MRFMAMGNSISVRFPVEMRDSLEEIAKASGLTAADLVRLATFEYVNKARETGHIQIPIVAEAHATYGSAKRKKSEGK